MFQGITNIAIDNKGGLVIFFRYRDAMMVGVGITELMATVDHTGRCLLFYPIPKWEKVEQILMVLPNINWCVRNMQRLILGYGVELEMDGQGRFLLPVPLREYATLDKKVVLMGQLNKLELWDIVRWRISCEVWLKAAQSEDTGSDTVFSQVSL